MNKVRIAIVGVGNCASSLVQGLEYYKEADPTEKVPGLMHVELGGYHVGDVEVVAAFDVDAKKVGTDVAEAIFTEPNNTIRFAEDVPPLGVTVQPRTDARRSRRVLPRGHHGVRRARSRCRAGPEGLERRRHRLLPPGRAPRKPRGSTRSARSMPASAS